MATGRSVMPTTKFSHVTRRSAAASKGGTLSAISGGAMTPMPKNPAFDSPILFYRVAYVLMALIALELIRGSMLEIWRG
jgi:hypothetical protein